MRRFLFIDTPAKNGIYQNTLLFNSVTSRWL